MTHPRWVDFIFLKRFNSLPYEGGWKDQPYSFIQFAQLAMHVEGIINATARTKKPKGRRKGKR